MNLLSKKKKKEKKKSHHETDSRLPGSGEPDGLAQVISRAGLRLDGPCSDSTMWLMFERHHSLFFPLLLFTHRRPST